MSERFDEADFKRLASRLTAYALSVFGEFGLGGKDFVIPGTGQSVMDFVSKTLGEYATGKLKHHASRGKVMTLLGTALRNDVIDALRKASHEREEGRPTTPEDGNAENDRPPVMDEYADDKTNDPIASLDEERYRARLRATLGTEPELVDVVEAVLDLNLTRPEDIAEVLDTTSSDIQNRKKKIRRWLAKHGIVRAGTAL